MNQRERDALARVILQVEELARSNTWLLARLEQRERELSWVKKQLARVHEITGRPWTPATLKYQTEEERVAARRRSWRESKERRKGLANGR